MKAFSPKFHRTDSKRHARIALASHMSLEEISVGMMLGDPQENEITQVHHVLSKDENMLEIWKDNIKLTLK